MSRRTQALIAIWVLPSALLLTLAQCVYARYRIDVPARLDPEAQSRIMATLRAALHEGEDAPGPGGLSRPLDQDGQDGQDGQGGRSGQGGPLVVTFWREGKQKVRVVARGATIDEAVAEAATRLATHPALARLNDRARRHGRIKVDLVVGRAPLAATSALIRAVGFNPGLEGLGVTVGSAGEVVLTPDDLVREHLHGTARPISFIPDFVIGFDVGKADALLGKLATQELGLQKADYESASRVYWRLRTDSFVERPQGAEGGPPLPLYRGIPPRPELTAEGLRAAAIAGGHYLVAHLAENGRYIYQRNLTTGRGTDPKRRGPYSIPRHAGTTYFLAELYRITGDESFREPVERAFAHLGELIEAGGCTGTLPGGAPFACVVDLGEKAAALGSTALTVVALAEYHRATGDDRYDELARQLAEWILYMQRPDGSFAHVYDLGTRTKDERAHLFYYSGEAALALARMHVVTGDDRYREATERALDEQVGWYDFFLGGFFYGEDHWTCIAAEAAYPAIKKDTYRVFCDGYGAFLRAQQPSADDFPDQEDWAGSYTFTPFILPQNTPAGSRTEAMISAYLLGTYHGQPNQALRAQILRALHYTLGQQIRPESDIAVSPAAHGHGAIPGSPVDRSVRIDYVQHVCSAMIRSTEVIGSSAR